MDGTMSSTLYSTLLCFILIAMYWNVSAERHEAQNFVIASPFQVMYRFNRPPVYFHLHKTQLNRYSDTSQAFATVSNGQMTALTALSVPLFSTLQSSEKNARFALHYQEGLRRREGQKCRSMTLYSTALTAVATSLNSLDLKVKVLSVGLPIALGYTFIRIFAAYKQKSTHAVAIVKTLEDAQQLHKYVCKDCGFTMYPAKGRESKFFKENFTCPCCGASKMSFYDENEIKLEKYNQSTSN